MTNMTLNNASQLLGLILLMNYNILGYGYRDGKIIIRYSVKDRKFNKKLKLLPKVFMDYDVLYEGIKKGKLV